MSIHDRDEKDGPSRFWKIDEEIEELNQEICPRCNQKIGDVTETVCPNCLEKKKLVQLLIDDRKDSALRWARACSNFD